MSEQAASTLNSLNLTESRGFPTTTSRSQFNVTVQRQNSCMEKLKEIQEQVIEENIWCIH